MNIFFKKKSNFQQVPKLEPKIEMSCQIYHKHRTFLLRQKLRQSKNTKTKNI